MAARTTARTPPEDDDAPKPGARERLLVAANELFYAEGVNAVGIDRVIARAGVAKASLYSAFGSKDELVRAYLVARGERRRARIEAHLAPIAAPRDKIVAVFALLEQLAAEPGYRGCAFVNASAEGVSGRKVGDACKRARAWVRGLFSGLARDAGAADPDALGAQLALLYDGTNVGGTMESTAGAVAAAATARTIAAALVDAAVPRGRRRAPATPAQSGSR